MLKFDTEKIRKHLSQRFGFTMVPGKFSFDIYLNIDTGKDKRKQWFILSVYDVFYLESLILTSGSTYSFWRLNV